VLDDAEPYRPRVFFEGASVVRDDFLLLDDVVAPRLGFRVVVVVVVVRLFDVVGLGRDVVVVDAGPSEGLMNGGSVGLGLCKGAGVSLVLVLRGFRKSDVGVSFSFFFFGSSLSASSCAPPLAGCFALLSLAVSFLPVSLTGDSFTGVSLS